VVFLHSKRASRRPTLLVGLIALSLFVGGPQMGSLDADGDGIPEIPVALATTNTVGLTTFKCEAALRQPIRDIANAVAILTQTHASDPEEYMIPFTAGRSALPFFCLLRC
jgi:hypothetical protein